MLIDDEQIVVVNPGSGSGSGSVSGGASLLFDNPVLSSEIGDLQFNVSAQSADFSIACRGEVFFSASAHSYGGKCILYQPGDVIAQFMIARGISFARFDILESRSSIAVYFYVLLSDRVFDGGFAAVSKLPLMAAPVSFARRRSNLYFSFFCSRWEYPSFAAVAHGYDYDGNAVSRTLPLASPVYVDDYISYILLSPADMEFSAGWAEIRMIEVRCSFSGSSLSAAVYILKDPDIIEFHFRNCFGLLESISLHAECIPVLTSEAQDARIGHRVVNYDFEARQSFSVDARNIARADWPKVSQFISSREIFDSSGRHILISDISSEIGKSYDSLGSLKFNYKYADDRIIAD